jgi:putative tricarboxylic transport membrane protein
MPADLRRYDAKRVVESILFLAIGISLLVYSRGMWGAKMEISMSPYLFPFMVGGSFTALASVLLLQGLGMGDIRSRVDRLPGNSLDWASVAVVTGFSIVYFLLLPVLHFMPATSVFLFALLYVLGEKRLWLCGAISVGTTAAIYVTFGMLLNVKLP